MPLYHAPDRRATIARWIVLLACAIIAVQMVVMFSVVSSHTREAPRRTAQIMAENAVKAKVRESAVASRLGDEQAPAAVRAQAVQNVASITPVAMRR